MNGVIFVKIDSNIQSCSTVKGKIAKIDAIIDSLYTTALRSVENGDTAEYQFDNGQTKISKTYTTIDAITKAIESYERIRSMLVVKLQPRICRGVDEGSFKRPFGGRLYGWD